MLSTPIAYVIFNRPKHTRETFASIREQRPAKLFIIADGPRPEHPTDIDRCREVREIVAHVDWPCEVHRNYSDTNLGCKMRPKTGIDWVFQHVDCAIILEDDCLPHNDFYGYCEALLERYKDEQKVMVITGNNFQAGKRRGAATYYFSKYNHIWGWATWKRAWLKNDSNIEFWPDYKLSQEWPWLFNDSIERKYWERIFDKVYFREFENAWDYPWTASVWYHGGLTATPNVNLVTNIGFGPEGTHTVVAEDQEGLPVGSLGPLTHPDRIEQDRNADRYVFDHHFSGRYQRWLPKLLRQPRRVVGGVVRRLKMAINT
jgi:hypothetical protein